MFSSTFYSIAQDDEECRIYRDIYQTAQPFPHVVITHDFLDTIFPMDHLVRLSREFPRPSESWWKYDNALERKYAKDDLQDEPLFRDTVFHMNSKPFVSFLEKVTGIQGLITDHTLRGGGLHQITRGGKLDLHIDMNQHPVLQLERRLNVILYLNEDWDESWGGHLELWDKDVTECKRKISPTLGTMVIFGTNEESVHGHPDPLTCPDGVTRKSIALYFWSNGRPEHEKALPHSTIYKPRPGEQLDVETEALRALRAKGRLT